jgi:DNA-binding CsgD family transcriptional regulator
MIRKPARSGLACIDKGDTELRNPFPGYETLPPTGRVALAQIIRGASSKEAGRTLGISPRTVDFLSANLLKKLGARSAADLVHKVLGE